MTETTAPAGIDRFASLDLIRGIAVMGIFSVNIIDFAMIRQAYLNPTAAGGSTGLDLAIWFANYVVIDGKMRTLFSILFGASTLLVIDRAMASGLSPARIHYARVFTLLLFGLLHFFLLWEGDILTLYALTGMIAFFFRKARVRTMLIWAAALLAISTTLWSFGGFQIARIQQSVEAGTASKADRERWQEMRRGFYADPAKDAVKTKIMRGPWRDRVEYFVTERAMDPIGQFAQFVTETLAYMLIGMAGLRSGFLTGAWAERRYRRVAAWTLGIGIPASILLGIAVIESGFMPGMLIFGLLGIGTPIHVAMALGYAALIILAARNPGRIAGRVAAVGRAAFTNYLGTSIVAATLFFGGGIALFGQLSRFEAWLVVPAVWLLMLAWSKPWLDRFEYGPLEWTWRSVSRGRVQRLAKRPALNPA